MAASFFMAERRMSQPSTTSTKGYERIKLTISAQNMTAPRCLITHLNHILSPFQDGFAGPAKWFRGDDGQLPTQTAADAGKASMATATKQAKSSQNSQASISPKKATFEPLPLCVALE
jgi:hypothetical protein